MQAARRKKAEQEDEEYGPPCRDDPRITREDLLAPWIPDQYSFTTVEGAVSSGSAKGETTIVLRPEPPVNKQGLTAVCALCPGGIEVTAIVTRRRGYAPPKKAKIELEGTAIVLVYDAVVKPTALLDQLRQQGVRLNPLPLYFVPHPVMVWISSDNVYEITSTETEPEPEVLSLDNCDPLGLWDSSRHNAPRVTTHYSLRGPCAVIAPRVLCTAADPPPITGDTMFIVTGGQLRVSLYGGSITDRNNYPIVPALTVQNK